MLSVEPPVLHHLTNDELKRVRQNLCSSSSPTTTMLLNVQLLTNHVELVTQASAGTTTVADFERDGFIRQMINSRSLMKKFKFKKQFVLSLCNLYSIK